MWGPSVDKRAVPSPDIPCAELVPLCKAICCALVVHLSVEDVAEGVVRWDPARPHWIAHANGRCVHLVPGRGCDVYDARPAPCRRLDCRTDRRIWLDYDRRIPNPKLEMLAVASANARAAPPLDDPPE